MAYANKDDLYAAQKRHRQKNRQALIEYLQSHPCVDCQETDLRVLDFDHVKGEKTHNVSRMFGGGHWSWKSILKEIEKCEVRCANCHRKRTHANLPWFKDMPL